MRLDDAETPLGQFSGSTSGVRGIEALTLVGDFDDEAVGVELVGDLDDARVLAFSVRVAHRVGRGLRQRELEVREQLVGKLTKATDARQSEPAEADVLGPGRDREPNRWRPAASS